MRVRDFGLLALLVSLLLLPVMSKAAESIVVKFPAKSIGYISFMGSKNKAMDARGTVSFPRERLAYLNINYDSASDLSPLLTLPADAFYKLNLSKLEVKDSQMKYVMHLTGLKSLGLRDTDVSDEGIKELPKLRELADLNVGASLITSRSLPYIGKLSKLDTLFLDSTNISDEGLENLCRLKNLLVLSLANTHITDDGVKKLSQIPNLEQLDVEFTNVSNAGIASLVGMKKLKVLRLANAKVNGKVIDTLAKIPKLDSVVYGDRNFSKKDLDYLHKVMPRCKATNYVKNRGVDIEVFAPLH